jgi:hypothetical protein
VKITKDVEREEKSEPSLWRGASFYVNHVFNTSKPKFRGHTPSITTEYSKKKKTPFVRVQANHTVPGFL